MEKQTIDRLRVMRSIGAEWSDKDVSEAYSGSLAEAVADLDLAKARFRRAFTDSVERVVKKLLIAFKKR